MNENDTRALVERLLQAFNASDHEGMLNCLSEDVAHDSPGTERQIGHDSFRWRLAEITRHFRMQIADAAIMTTPGGVRAAAEFTARGTYLSTLEGFPEAHEQSLQLPAGIFLDIDDDGLISRLSICFDPKILARNMNET
ncbi:nuclear transport factor 2 family protein [Chelativorans sp. YIM 93263]|uniref:nuclear transport factor 2 family protein n=1 Tax=Chelativorans sp. YIM 93263 TaxID=2906648 RepID=UPI0023784BE7|nr:nuclear transport factor 2 family protein [Chelativorans sp. YIM 93263]